MSIAVVVDLLKANQPVWFGCDVGQASNSQLGIMDTALFDLQTPFGVTLGMTKAQRLQTYAFPLYLLIHF